MTKHYAQKKRGFSLVETLVAISILMISIAGPMVLVANGIRSSAFSRDQITAFYLAQDAIEGVRYIRDGNRIEKVLSANPDGVAWDALTQYSCTDANPCGIDTYKLYVDGSNFISQETANDFMSMDSFGIYRYMSGSSNETRFKRWITITAVDDKEVEIEVTIDWSSGIFTRQFKVKESLFYWY